MGQYRIIPKKLLHLQNHLLKKRKIMKNIIAICFAFVILFTSCKTSEEIYFKKDFSGQFNSTIDFKQMLDLMQAAAASKGEKNSPDSIKLVVQELLKKTKEGTDKLQSIKGITNVKMDILGETSYKVTFDFVDVVALNQAYDKMLKNNESQNTMFEKENKKETTTTAKPFQYFSLKSKELTYARPKGKTDEKVAGGEGEEMMKMMEYKMKFSFEKRKLKKITNDGKLDLKSDENSVYISPNIETLQKGLTLKIKVK